MTLGVLISGRGSNLQAIIDAIASGDLAATIAVVISNRADAAGLARAERAGIPTLVMPHKAYADRAAYDRALAGALKARGVELVCLAGFMRLLGPAFIDQFPNAVLNIHPSLLPAFPGLDAQQQAFEHGVKVAGATVHLVTPELDAGPIVAQEAVAVSDDDTAETLAARILEVEHRLYPAAIARLTSGRWWLGGAKVAEVCNSSVVPGSISPAAHSWTDGPTPSRASSCQSGVPFRHVARLSQYMRFA